MSKLKLVFTMIVLSTLSFTCVSFASNAKLPAISKTSGHQQHGAFVWFDLLTHDHDKVQTYYENLFGWKISEAVGEARYSLITNKGSIIGGIAKIEKEEQSVWLGSISIGNVEKAVARVKQMGGKVLEPVQTVDDRGVMALVEDNMGAAFVLLNTGSRDPAVRPVQAGDWLWTDLFTNNTTKAGKFYKKLVGLQLKTVSDNSKNKFDLLMLNGKMKSGVVKTPWNHVAPIWLPYILVESLTETLKKSIQLGGRMFSKFEGGAILLDPTGAAFGIQQMKGK